MKKQDLGQTLAFRRAMDISDAGFTNIENDNKSPIKGYYHGMRTTVAYDTSKNQGDSTTKGEGNSANLSAVENAKLDTTCDTLGIDFSINVLPLSTTPEMADDAYRMNLISEQNKKLLLEDEIVLKVAKYYAYNILNASWAWRNREIANNIEVEVKHNKKIVAVANNAQKMPLYPVLTSAQVELGLKNPLDEYNDLIEDLANLIKKRWQGNEEPLILEVVGKLEIANGSQVYPSQLFSTNTIKTEKGSKIGRLLYKMPFSNKAKEQVGITGEKINNALRKFDLLNQMVQILQQELT